MVSTPAELSLRDGVIEHIEVGEDCDDLEHLIEEYVESVDGTVRAEVSYCPKAGAYVVNADGLSALARSKSSCAIG